MIALKRAVPWWARIAAKIVLARLPIPYSAWKRLRLFEHGDMNQPERAWNGFLELALTAGIIEMQAGLPRLKGREQGYSILEIGPGDALFSAVIARSLGISRSWMVDAGAFATTDVRAYTALLQFLRKHGVEPPFSGEPATISDLLNACNCEYLVEGVKSLSELPPDSVDYCFSNAVLEHIPNHDFPLLASGIFRVLKSDGVSLHRVDLKDHLGGNLENLRFSDSTWEGPLFRNSGFYTNRIRLSEMVAMFEHAGLECKVCRIARWDTLPTPRHKLAAAFRDLPDDDLLVSDFDILLRRKA